MARLLLLSVVAVLLSCSSNAFRAGVARGSTRDVLYPFAVSDERQTVFPHLHYSVDMRSLDKEQNLVELSFYFLKEQGDSLLWIECVEKVPVALIDTTGHKKWAYQAL